MWRLFVENRPPRHTRRVYQGSFELQKSGQGVTTFIEIRRFATSPDPTRSYSASRLPAPCLHPASVDRFLDLKRQHPEIVSDLQLVIIVHHEFGHVRGCTTVTRRISMVMIKLLDI